MLSKPHRVPRSCFQVLFKSGKRLYGNFFSLVTSPNQLPLSRFAVVVPKKIAQRAVDRNRMKRLVSESIRHLLPTIKPGIDCIIIAKTNFAEKKQQEVETELYPSYSGLQLQRSEKDD